MVSESFYRNCFFLTTLFVILVCLIVAFLNFDEAKFTGQFECGRIQSVTPVYIQTKHNGTKAKKNILIAFGDEKLLSRVVSSNTVSYTHLTLPTKA